MIVEYLHEATQTVWEHYQEYPTDTEMYWAFQQTTKPEELGFRYKRKFEDENIGEVKE